jgi:DNA ligase D-like protein (predicted polymerase)
MADGRDRITVQIRGEPVEISHPDRVIFPAAGHTKLDLVHYYEAVADGALHGAGGRPNVLVRFMDGAAEPAFWQKRAPSKRPAFVDTVVLKFPSGREAEEVVPRNAATLAWMNNLGCIELHPHPVRAESLEHPDELRVDLDPGPGVGWAQIREVARTVRALLEELGITGWPKTSGSRGVHIYVRIEPRWTFTDVRQAALALAREVERRVPHLATSKWWKEERHGVFIDYNQNAKDRTVASAYSVRPRPDARVSAPVTWDELDICDPADFTLRTMPARYAQIGDPHAGMDARAYALDALLELATRDRAAGLGDAPWPPHYLKQADEPPRVQPSKRRGAGTGRRTPKHPLLEIARAATEAEARAGLDRWKARHPEAAQHLHEDDVLVDQMRGRSSTWTRIRVNLRHVPAVQRPPQEPPDPDFNPWSRRPRPRKRE